MKRGLAIWPILVRHTARRLGIRIAPHDCRDAGATTWAIAAPDQIGIARDLFGHSNLGTTTRHYNRAKGVEASRAHALVIKEMRRKAVPDPLSGTGAALSACNSEAMQLHLDEIATKVTPGAHAIVLLDQAGWHGPNPARLHGFRVCAQDSERL